MIYVTPCLVDERDVVLVARERSGRRNGRPLAKRVREKLGLD